MSACPQCGKPVSAGDNFCAGCGAVVQAPTRAQGIAAGIAPAMHAFPAPHSDADGHTLRRIAEYERIAAILWICLGACQVLMVVTIIAGAWNIYAGWSRLKLPDMIRARDRRIPALYENNVAQLVVIGVLNLVLGGMIGVVFVGFDFIIRDMVLRNRHLFAGARAGTVDA